MNKILSDIHIKLLGLLLKNKVEFIIIGGYAVIIHGYVRTTGDLDIWLKPDNDNKRRLVEALREFRINKESLNAVTDRDFTQAIAFHYGFVPDKVDFITRTTGITFDAAIKKVDIFQVDEIMIPVLNLHDLIINKTTTNRTKDKLDVEELQKIMQIKKKQG
jgi:hypothetical protein